MNGFDIKYHKSGLVDQHTALLILILVNHDFSFLIQGSIVGI